jgi:hypothetical protein
MKGAVSRAESQGTVVCGGRSERKAAMSARYVKTMEEEVATTYWGANAETAKLTTSSNPQVPILQGLSKIRGKKL